MKKLRVSPSPRWSFATSFWFSTVATLIVVPLITILVHKSIWIEMEIVTGILATIMFIYFTVILHQGVRFADKRKALIDWPSGRPLDILDSVIWTPDSPGIFTEVGAEGGCFGLIFGFLVDMVVMIVLSVIISVFLWIGANLVMGVMIYLFWVHTRWLRYLVTTGRRCRGNWAMSVTHGFVTTLRFTVWFYMVFFIAHKVANWFAD